MGYAWRSNADGTAEAVECDPFAEVVYENDQVLVVNVARGVLPDLELENALVDALALSEHRPDAEHAIAAAAVCVRVRTPSGRSHRAACPDDRAERGLRAGRDDPVALDDRWVGQLALHGVA